MKKVLFLIFFCLNLSSTSALETKIIYTIENEIITNIDIKNEFKYLMALNNKLEELDKETIFIISKESIIKEKIKKIEISKRFTNLNIDENYINVLLKKIYTNLNFESLEEFNLHLNTYNLSIEEVKEKLTIDALWNELIVNKYRSKIEIDEEKLKYKIMNSTKKENIEYNLSEIIYEIENKDNIEVKYQEIKESINKIGFENSASIYSISDTAKIGGNIGWIQKKSLNQKIFNKILELNLDEISKPIILPNGILILKINEVKKIQIKIDYEQELKKMINYEQNRQLNQYSKIYFNKVKKNIGFNE
jgi:peptidyl-prolyl cis-trans isomerase SurA